MFFISFDLRTSNTKSITRKKRKKVFKNIRFTRCIHDTFIPVKRCEKNYYDTILFFMQLNSLTVPLTLPRLVVRFATFGSGADAAKRPPSIIIHLLFRYERRDAYHTEIPTNYDLSFANQVCRRCLVSWVGNQGCK